MTHADAAGVRMAIEPLNRFETHFVNRGRRPWRSPTRSPRTWGSASTRST